MPSRVAFLAKKRIPNIQLYR